VQYVKKMHEKYRFKPPILETCSGQIRSIQNLFPKIEYIRQDLVAYPNVELVCDVCNMKTVEDNCFSTVFNFESLEHIQNPFQAIKEMHRVLEPGGFLVLTTVTCWVIHRHPLDCWRFLPDGIKILLKDGFNILNLELEGLPYNFAIEDVPLVGEEKKTWFHRGIFTTAKKS